MKQKLILLSLLCCTSTIKPFLLEMGLLTGLCIGMSANQPRARYQDYEDDYDDEDEDDEDDYDD